jgi:ribosome-binding factor A
MLMSRRTERVNDLIRDELSDLLLREINDPRLGGLISITRVDVSPDLANARVFVSVMGDEPEQQQAMKALSAAGGFLHRELKKRLEMRKIPFLSFRLDTSIARGAEVLSLLNQVHEEDAGRGAS